MKGKKLMKKILSGAAALMLAASALPTALSEESGNTVEAESGTLLGSARIVKIGHLSRI